MAWRGPIARIVFSRYLLLTNTAVSGLLDGLGDHLQQNIFERVAVNDWNRTGRMAAIGLALGPVEHYWYVLLERRLPLKTARIIALKVLLDELVMGPLTLCVFFTGMSTLEGKSFRKSLQNLTNNFWPAFKVELFVWPIVQVINFYFIPLPLRVIYMNVVYLFWSMFLSHLQHK